MDDLYLINQVKETGSSEAFREITQRHSGLYLQVLDNSLPSEQFPLQKEDFRAEREFYIYDAVMKFEPSKGMKFSTYLGQTIKWKCLTLRHRGNDKDTCSLEPLSSYMEEQEYLPPQRKEQIEKIFQYAENFPDETVRNVVLARYNDGRKTLSWKKVADKVGISSREANLAYQKFVKEAKKDLSD